MASTPKRLRPVIAIAAFGLTALFTWQLLAPKSLNAAAGGDYAGNTAAPEFPAGLDWINTGGQELTFEKLLGKVVLLDFWTYGCINCIHIIPDLKKLEAKYPDELVVIGVHSAKFEHESRTENIRNIVKRYELEHPVVNDRNMDIWRSFGVNAWPTRTLIDPEGKVIGSASGEGQYELFDRVIGGAIEQFDTQDKISRKSLGFVVERAEPSDLMFPGKVLADDDGKRLFIADSNNNRIVIARYDGKVTDVVGGKKAGLEDGTYKKARFDKPQGLTLADKNTLYVADTGNHTIRRIDLRKKTVESVAGTGEKVYQRSASGPARTTGISSPWDVVYHDGLVYIAMAGQHQVWAYDPEEETLFEFAGTRREALLDGQRLAAGFNQPSGLAVHGGVLYVADSEASAIRAIGLDKKGMVETIVGTGLFDFGDRDGVKSQVLLQHPLGVIWFDDQLVIADTYNSKIKRIDPETGFTQTLELDDMLGEPGGLSYGDEKLFVADTNGHRIVAIDPNSGKANTFSLEF